MAITIIRNQDGNCITFRGSTNPVYFNACLSGEVAGTGALANYVNVRNDVASAGGSDIYEFYQIEYTEFRRADNSTFTSAQEAADYITSQGNVLEVQSASYLGTWNASTNTPTVGTSTHTGSTGDFYFVGVAGTTTVDGVSNWKNGERIIWNGDEWQQLRTSSLIEGKTISTLHDTQTQIFADGEAATRDPNLNPGWYYTNTENNKINWYFYGDTPIVDNSLGSLDGAYAIIDFRNASSQPFFGIYTKPEGDGQDQTWFRSRVNYSDTSAISLALDPAQDGTNTGLGKYLVHTGNIDSATLALIEPLLPRISLSLDASTTIGLQGDSEEIYLLSLSTSSGRSAGSEQFVVEKFGYVIGGHQSEYLLTALPTTGGSVFDETPSTIDFQREATDTTILANDGQQFSVNSIRAVANGDGTVNIVALPGLQTVYSNVIYGNITITGSAAGTTENGAVNALNALFTNLPLGAGGSYVVTYPTTDAVGLTSTTSAEATTPVTTKSDNTTVHLQTVSGTSGHDSRLWTTQTIDTSGEYYLVKIVGNGRFIIGLGSEDNDDYTEIANNSGTAHSGLIWGQAFYDYGSYTAPWTIYGSSAGLSYGPGWTGATTGMMRYNSTVQNELTTTDDRDGALFKIGIDQNGYIACWYYDAGRSNEFILTSRRNVTTAAGNYFLVVKLWDQTATLVETPQRSAVDPAAPALTYRYIESPDGSFYYPLFSTAEEANYVDTANGGSGESHSHIFVDEPTGTTWYMPDNGGTHAGASAPSNTEEITYTEIPTNADELYAPAALNIQNYSVVENQTVNLQIIPQDVVATVTGLPSGLTYSNGYITGTAGYVIRDTDYTVTVERSNSYGTTTETFTISVTDNASLSNIAGFTETQGNFVQPNRIILSHDALLQYDTQISPGEELTYSYGGGQIPPTIGILSATGVSDLAAFDPATDTLGTGDYNFAEQLKWALRYVSFGGYIGGDSGKYNLRGWTDNSTQSGAEGTLANTEFKLEYGVDGYFRLYVGGTLKLTSASTFSGAQTLTLAGFDDQAQSDVYIPANWTIASSVDTDTPPTGFVDPVESGEMTTSTLFGPSTNGAVFLTETLKVNHRYIVPRAWIEANVLPNIAGAGAGVGGEKFYFGVPKDAADWTAVDLAQDFHAAFRLEGDGSFSWHTSRIHYSGNNSTAYSQVTVNSTTSAFYDYAIEWDGTDLHVIACNIGDINTQPGINNGGSFSRVVTLSGFATAHNKTDQALNLVIAVKDDASVNLTTAGLQQIRIPFGARDVIVGEISNGSAKYTTLQPAASKFDEADSGHASYDGVFVGPTLNAGYTYRFYYHPSMESGDAVKIIRADDGTDYTTGVTFFGNINADPQFYTSYKGLQFAVPTDAPPLKIAYLNTYQGNTTYTSGVELPISGSTYTVPVTGVTIEGPSGNFTGNVINATTDGWISLNETLSAGERLVLDSAFIQDLNDALPDHCIFWVGLKANGWTNTTFPTSSFFGGTAIRFYKTGGSEPGIRLFGYANGGTSSQIYSASLAASSAFLEITSTGNNIRLGYTHSSSYDASTDAYADWDGNTKIQTGDRGYGISSLDVVLYWQALGSNTVGFDISDVDWTGLSEINNPTPAAPLTTNWTKAVDFSGSAERTRQVSAGMAVSPLRMADTTATRTAPTTAGNTTSGGHPWATAIVFSSDNNYSNQHIWNQGEGAGSTDDNIYLRVDSLRNLYFGWGRSGALNECSLGTLASGSGHWYGIYIAHNGTRLSGANATAANLADCFDIRGINLQTGSVGSEISTATNWVTTGGRMDRSVTGDFTVGGRGSNRNFHGKVASMVVTTLKNNDPMPTDAEISMMVRDPQQWVTDYKANRSFRRPHQTYNTGNFLVNSQIASYSTQVWLMGDGTSDAYAHIRNQIWASSQNYTPLNMLSMVSNDIETVNIPGLT